MRIDQKSRNPTVPEALLIYFAVLFFWHFIFSFLQTEFDNVDFLKWSATTATIYWIAKTTLEPNFLGRPLNSSDTAEITLLSTATILLGVGCWSLLVFFDAVTNNQLAIERWGLIPRQTFNDLHWSTPWIIGNLITSSFLTPITEEIVFRVFVLRRLRERYSPGLSITISAGLFAALHFNKSYLGAFVHGLIFAVLVIRTSSIYAAILVHGLYNATIFAFMVFFGFSVVGDAKVLARLSYWTPELLCGLAGLALLAFYLFVWPFGRYHKTTFYLWQRRGIDLVADPTCQIGFPPSRE